MRMTLMSVVWILLGVCLLVVALVKRYRHEVMATIKAVFSIHNIRLYFWRKREFAELAAVVEKAQILLTELSSSIQHFYGPLITMQQFKPLDLDMFSHEVGNLFADLCASRARLEASKELAKRASWKNPWPLNEALHLLRTYYSYQTDQFVEFYNPIFMPNSLSGNLEPEPAAFQKQQDKIAHLHELYLKFAKGYLDSR